MELHFGIFFNSWSQIFQAIQHNNNNNFCLANPPILNRWFPEGYSPDSNIPLSYSNQSNKVIIESQVIKERIFHFSSESISLLKSKINQECGTKTISSFQSLSAMIWRCITRAQRLPYGRQTSISFAANNRGRIKPPLGENYFGKCMSSLVTTTKVGELLENELGWAALKIHQTVNEHTSEKIDQICKQLSKSPMILMQPSDNHMVISIGSSPRFNMYEIEFGMGKAVAVRSGYANKFDGKIRGYPGREGGGSVDLAVCLNPKCMEVLEGDQEFMSLVSS